MTTNNIISPATDAAIESRMQEIVEILKAKFPAFSDYSAHLSFGVVNRLRYHVYADDWKNGLYGQGHGDILDDAIAELSRSIDPSSKIARLKAELAKLEAAS